MSEGSPIQFGPDNSRRRSQRVILTMGVTVGTVEGPKVTPFEEETHTIVVNVHGALVVLAGPVTKGQKLRLTNRATREVRMCRVASMGPTSEGKTQIGIEFLKPSPDFWQISFPPEDWVVPEPSSTNSDNG